jgi:hypothetical protein
MVSGRSPVYVYPNCCERHGRRWRQKWHGKARQAERKALVQDLRAEARSLGAGADRALDALRFR